MNCNAETQSEAKRSDEVNIIMGDFNAEVGEGTLENTME